MNADAALARLAADPADAGDLAHAVLALATDEYPDLDAGNYLRRLDDFASELAPKLVGCLESKVGALSEFLFEREGFIGNAPFYHDPRNSYLNDVIDRKLGIPITLSLLAMAVGRRCDLEIVGVGLPGHFVAKAIEGQTEVIFDPFHGGMPLSLADCSALVESVCGAAFDPTPENLAATPPRAIVRRVLTNLKSTYTEVGDYRRAARVTGRLAQLDPTDLLQRRDWGVFLAQAGEAHRAIDPLEAYLAAKPQDHDTLAVQQYLKHVRGIVAGWN